MPNIEFIPISLVDDYDKNSNTHPQSQIENIKALMLYVGWTVPALVRKTGDRYGLIAGHGRREAANELQGKSLKMADGTPIPAGCIPVLFADGWSDEQIRAYVIADNQVPRQSIFDESILAEELQALQDSGLDLGMIGFDEGELERLLASMEPEPEYQTDPDDAPDVDEESTPVSVRGMVWLCGNHRVMCGDSTSSEEVRKLMNGKKADLVFTDPPYGLGFDKEGQTIGNSGKYGAVLNDSDSDVAKSAFNLCRSLGIDHLFFWGANHYSSCLPDSSCWIVWDKQGGKSVTYADCELCFTSINKPVRMFTHIWDGFRRDSEKGDKRVHPNQKPVALFVEIWEKFDCGKLVLDLFGGSGTTLIACEQNGRDCQMIELSQMFVDVIVKRWQQFTGKQATLEGDGRTFNEIASLCH